MFDKHAALIVEELTIHGYLEMSSVLLKATAAALLNTESSEAMQSQVADNSDRVMNCFLAVRESFQKLAESCFVERAPQLESTNAHVESNESNGQKGNGHTNGHVKSKVPRLISNEYERFSIPHLTIKCRYKLL
jgi:hypothetical protein